VSGWLVVMHAYLCVWQCQRNELDEVVTADCSNNRESPSGDVVCDTATEPDVADLRPTLAVAAQTA